jgi:hypothetical protein
MADTLAELLVELNVPPEQIDHAIKRVNELKGEAKELGTEIDRTNAKWDGLKEGAVAVAGVAAAFAAAVAGLFHFVESQTTAIAAMNDTAKAVGLGVEEYQRLRFAADQSGVSQETLATGMTKFNATLLELQRGGGKKAEETLTQLGLSLQDLNGLSRTQQIGVIGDALQNVSNEAERSALAATLFGKSAGPQMAQLLAEGSAGLEQLTAAAQGVLSEDDVARAAVFDDQLQAVKAQVEALMQGIAVELIPVISDVVESMSQWLAENDELIRQGIGGFIEGISQVTKELTDTMGALVSAVQLVDDAFSALRPDVEGSTISFGDLLSEVLRLTNPLHAVAAAVSDIQSAMAGATATAFSFSTSLADVASMKAAIEKGEKPPPPAPPRFGGKVFMDQGTGPAGGGRGGGGGGGGAKTSDKQTGLNKALAKLFGRGDGVTAEELISGIRSGNADIVGEKLRGFAQRSPSAKDVKPTVAIDFFNFSITQHIEAHDTKGAARESAEQIRKEFQRATAKAGQSITTSLLR